MYVYITSYGAQAAEYMYCTCTWPFLRRQENLYMDCVRTPHVQLSCLVRFALELCLVTAE